MKQFGLTIVATTALSMTLAMGCSSSNERGGSENGGTIPTSPSQQQSTQGNVKVDRVRAFVKDGRVQAFVEGEIGDGCTRLQPMVQTRSENTINVSVSSIRQGDVCTMILQLLNGYVPLNGTFEPGTYTLRANSAVATFTLTRDGSGQLAISPDPGPLPTGPTYP